MANDINKIVVVGRLTRDPELRFTPNGSAIVKFSIAIGRSYTVNNEKKDEVSYVDVTAWGKFAEMIGQYYKKGQRVAIDGKLQQSRWEQDGQKKSKIEIVADNIQPLSFNDDQGSNPDQQQSTPAAPSQQSSPDGNPFSDGDIPF